MAGPRTAAKGGARIGLAAVALAAVLATPSAAAVRWVTGYYPSYRDLGPPQMHPGDFDYAALTHVIHWPVIPLADGTLDPRSFDPFFFGMTAAQSADVVSRAHAAGTRALLGFGGDVNTVGLGWTGATSPANRAQFITNMVSLMQARGYDGIDINWEGLTPADEPQFTPFIQELRAALDAISPRPLLTMAPTTGPSAPVALVAGVRQHFDQINIQTYFMSGPYPGWVTWFNSPIYNGGATFPFGGPLPSADAEVDRFVAGGIPVGNLGIGIQFDGTVWTGGSGMVNGGPTAPRQVLNDADPPAMNFMRTAAIMATYTPANGFTRTFDAVARVPWIGRNDAVDANDTFISFDDEQAIQEKADYIAQKGLGGVFVFELSGDFFPGEVGDARHPLLTALRNAFRQPGGVPVLSLVIRATDNSIRHSRFDGTTWGGFVALPGATADIPALASSGGGILDLVVRGLDNGVYHNHFDGMAWSGWTALPGATADIPALAASGGGILDLVVRGTDNGIYHNHYNGAAWSGWTALPGATADIPALAASGGGQLDLVVRGTDNGVYHNHFNGTAWSGWTALPGATADIPALAASGGGILDLVVRGTDNGVYHNHYAGAAWGGWTALPGATADIPALAASGGGPLDLVVRGIDNRVYHNHLDGATWSGWTALPGATADIPGLVARGGGQLDLVVRGTDNRVYHNHFNGVTWSGWTVVPGVSTFSRPAVAVE